MILGGKVTNLEENKSKRRRNITIALVVGGVLLASALAFGIHLHLQAVENDKQAREKAAEQARIQQIQEQAAEEQSQKESEERRNAALASIQFDTDPENQVPVMRIEDLIERVYAQRNSLDLEEGQKVRIIATLSDQNLYDASLDWERSPKPFLIQHVEFKFYPILLRALQSGDEVEFIAEFDSFRRDPSDHYAGETMSFQGIEIRKVPH
jgi:hypothetical protein